MGGVESLLNPQVYNATGLIVNGPNTSIQGCGAATVSVYGSLVRVDFSFVLAAEDTSTTRDWNWGINRNLLRNINPNIPMFNWVNGGTWIGFTEANALNVGRLNYGGFMDCINEFARFSRVYTQEGGIGAWESNLFKVGCLFYGCAFGVLA